MAQCGRVLPSFDKTFRTSMQFLQNPQKLWHSERLEHKRTLLKLAFDEYVVYDRNQGFRTAAKSLPFLALEGFGGGNYEMVDCDGERLNMVFSRLQDCEEHLEPLDWSVYDEMGGLDL